MLRHVILWKLKDDIADLAAVKAGIKAGLEGLVGKCQGILLELRIEKRLIEIGFSRLRVNLPGMLKEVESCRILAGSLLARS